MKKLETENKSVKQSLQQAENENRTLAANAAANRKASREPSVDKEKEKEKKAPVGVARSTSAAPRTGAVVNAEAAKDAQIRQLKEELYSDLTGLIIRGVKREDGEDIYDCIQTGRNGSKFAHHRPFSSFLLLHKC